MPFGDGRPVVDAGPAQGIRPDPHALGADRVDVHHVGQVGDVGVHVVVPLGVLQRPRQRHPLHLGIAAAQNLVGALGDCTGGVGVGRPTVGWVVLESAVAGRIVRRGDDDPVGQRRTAAPVVGQDGVADRRRRRVPVGRINQHRNVVGGQHLQRRHPGRFGQAVGVTADEQRAGGALRGPVLGDGLRGGQDVRFVEGAVQAGTAVPGRAERDLLSDVVRIRLDGVIRRHQMGQVDEIVGLRRLPGAGIGSHGAILPRRARYLRAVGHS